jgi:hypothetical protein
VIYGTLSFCLKDQSAYDAMAHATNPHDDDFDCKHIGGGIAVIKKICVIANHFPTKTDPIYSFLKEIVDSFADRGIECHVITPKSYFGKEHRASDREMRTKNKCIVRVHCPKYFVCSPRLLGTKRASVVNGRNYCRAAYAVFRERVENCDIIYSHFLIGGGLAASYISK